MDRRARRSGSAQTVRFVRVAALLATATVATACSGWRDRVDSTRAAADPEQQDLSPRDPAAEPIELELKGYRVRLTPRARYGFSAYAIETSRKLLDEWDFIAPMDLAIAWGPVASPEVLKRLRFHLSGRYVSYRWEGEIPGISQPVLASHIANNHLVPADEDVARALKRVRIGDLVTLRGLLVDLEVRDRDGRVRHSARTSVRRDDIGSGACEQIWVESVDVERP